jgi:hypothetical protein
MDHTARHPEAFEGLRGGHFVDEMAVDIQQACTIVGFVRDMGVPDLVIESLSFHGILARVKADRRIRALNAYANARTVVIAPKNLQGRRERSSMSKTICIALIYACRAL